MSACTGKQLKTVCKTSNNLKSFEDQSHQDRWKNYDLIQNKQPVVGISVTEKCQENLCCKQTNLLNYKFSNPPQKTQISST